MLRYTTDRTWFSRLVRHLARKWSRSYSYNSGANTEPFPKRPIRITDGIGNSILKLPQFTRQGPAVLVGRSEFSNRAMHNVRRDVIQKNRKKSTGNIHETTISTI